ncbi:MAG: histidine kinase [Chitinophagaceae bacterium]
MNLRCQFYWILLILLAVSLSTHAQANRKDSVYVFGLIDKAEKFFGEGTYDSSLHYCNLAETYSRSRSFKKGIAYALIERTDIFIDKDELDNAAALHPATLAIGFQLKDSLIMAISYMQQAQVKMYGNQPDEAIPFFEKSVAYWFGKHSSRYAALAYNDFGYTYGLKGDLSNKAQCLLRSVAVYESLGDGYYGEKAAAYNNLATLYYELKQRDKTIEYALKSIANREKAGDIERLSLGCCNLSQFYLGVNNAEAVKYQKLCVKYAEQSGNESRIVHSYSTSALLANEQHDTAAALNYELKIVALLEKSKRDPLMLARRYIAVGMAYMQKDSVLAMSYFNKSLKLSESLKDKFNLRDLFYQLAVFYKKRKDYERAYDYYNKHILYRDSIIKSNTASAIADLEKKYESEKKDNLITRLNDAQAIKTLKIEKQDALLAANLLEAQKKQNEIDLLSKTKALQELEITQQDELLEKQMLTARNNQQQLELSEKEKLLQEKQLKNSRNVRNLLLAGVVLLLIIGYFLFNRYQLKRKIAEQQSLLDMRNNIAKDLHDEIGSTLTSIRILSEVSGKSVRKDDSRSLGFIQKITEQSAAAQQGISDIVWAVKPENDKLENMVIRMREYAAHTLESRNILTTIHIDEELLDQTLDMQQRRDFFLIYKEAINNIAKYADATEVTVTIGNLGGNLSLQVADNGKGFNTAAIGSSNGVKNMQARAHALNGEMLIQSQIGKGTLVHLQIPTT